MRTFRIVNPLNPLNPLKFHRSFEPRWILKTLKSCFWGSLGVIGPLTPDRWDSPATRFRE